MTKKYYDKIADYTFRILTKVVSATNQDARLYELLYNPKHEFFDREPKRMFQIEGENRSLLVIEAEEHQIDEIKDAYHSAKIIKDQSEREQYLLRDIEKADELGI